jgi:hypothetical protein
MSIKVFLGILIFLICTQVNSFSSTITEGDTTIIAGKHYKARWLKKIFLGSHYRKEWSTPVTVPIFDIDTIKGGLTPLKLGGNRQTTNLRLKDRLGREYVIRSVDKNPSRVLPEKFRKTIAGKIIEDQTSAEHPYASTVIPHLADAANIYHTNPQLYFIPYDTSFGEYTETFAGMLVYFEERPNENMSHSATSGNASNVIGTEKLFENLYKDPDNKVDERFFVKSRLFDMWIGDWGRHEDQWRWGEYKQEEGNLYRPIPRDRDHAFFKFDGILPFIGSKRASLKQFTNFDSKIKNIYGLNKSATSLDRALLNNLNKQDWISIAEELKSSLTDEAIKEAFANMPADIYKLHGRELIKKLKSRRNYLPKAASRYYKEISKNVDITGSNKEEYFIARRQNTSTIEVTVLKLKNHNDTLYHRILNGKETDEIRLYGLGGNDEFHLYGKSKKGPRIRLVGGEGDDIYTDSSMVSGLINKHFIYDTKKGSIIHKGIDTKVATSDNPEDSITVFKRTAPDYNYTSIIPTAEYNPDDGIFLGIGIIRKTFGFRKDPYESHQRISLNYSTQTSAVSFRYWGDYKNIIGDINLKVDSRIFGPRFAFNYFGFGNNSVYKDTSIEYYRVRAYRFIVEPFLYKENSKGIEIGIGPHYEYANIQKTRGRFISEPGAVADENDYEANNYVGINSYIEISSFDNMVSPSKGIRWFAHAGAYDRLESNTPYANINSNISFFYTPPLPFRITLGTRIGASTNFGDFAFYRGNMLGGTTNLRGYRKSRFIGRSSAYQNFDARIYLGTVNFFLFPGKVGLIAFYDYGRVWADGEKSNNIHTGYGPGLFIQVLDRAVLSGTYGFSEDFGYFNVQLGFQF